MNNFNYSLDNSKYTLTNALLWGNFAGHASEATSGSLGNRIVHALIAIVELLPVISQIASIFEMIIVTSFNTENSENKDLSNHTVTLQSDSAKKLNLFESPESIEKLSKSHFNASTFTPEMLIFNLKNACAQRKTPLIFSDLDLSGYQAQFTKMGPEAVKEFFSDLFKLPNLKIDSLNLSTLPLTSLDANVFKTSQVTINKSLNLANSQLNTNTLNTLLEVSKNIQILDMTSCSTIQDIEAIRLLKNLTYLDLTSCLPTDKNIENIFSLNQNMIYLNLSGCKLLTDTSLKTIGKNCPNLSNLNMSYCPHITSKGLKQLNKLKLNKIDFSGCELIGDSGVKSISENSKNLLDVKLRNCPKISDDSVKSLLKNNPNLSVLEISQCKITNKSLKLIAEKGKQLTELDISYNSEITTEGVELMLSNVGKNLTSLNLEALHISKGIVNFIAHTSPKMKNLNINILISRGRVELKTLAQKCPNLEKLCLIDMCPTNMDMTNLAIYCPNLTHLELGPADIDDSYLENFVKQCKKLKHLDFSNASITSSGLESIAKYATELTHLGIKQCDKVENLYPLFGCQKLVSLNVGYSNCSRLSILQFLEKFTQLKFLVIKFNKLTQADITTIRAQNPNLYIQYA